jgi:hypothetical protein
MTNSHGPQPEITSAFLLDQLAELNRADYAQAASIRAESASPEFGTYVSPLTAVDPSETVIQLKDVRRIAQLRLGAAALPESARRIVADR